MWVALTPSPNIDQLFVFPQNIVMYRIGTHPGLVTTPVGNPGSATGLNCVSTELLFVLLTEIEIFSHKLREIMLNNWD